MDSPVAQPVKCVLMETPVVEQPRELPVVAGDLALDFANTVDDPEGPERHDHVAGYAGLVAWSVRVTHLAPASADRLLAKAHARPEEALAALAQAHDLRALLNDTFGEVARSSGVVIPATWSRLRPYVAASMEQAGLEKDGDKDGATLSWTWPESDRLDAPLWPVAQAAAALLTGPHLQWVKQCAVCPWLFVDRSRNHGRRWCSMDDCGTHEKIRRYVSRRAQRRTTG